MKQSIFEIRQQAEELLKQAITIWRQSSQSDQLEGIENDPVFSLMLTALAYQLNDIDFDIARIKQEVLDEFAKRLVPYQIGRAQPATAIIATQPQQGVSAVAVGDGSVFRLGGSGFQFIPLLQTRVLGAEVASVVRLDARRWKVGLRFKTPVTDLSRFAFAITNPHFTNVKLTIDGKLVPLFKPWHYADLPLCRSFALDNMLYGQMPPYDTANIWLDLFARQNVRVFCIKQHDPSTFIKYEAEALDLVFEFSGIGEGFVFDKSALALNAVVLANAVAHSVTLTAENPVARVAGYGRLGSDESEQFLHLTRPDDEQIYKNLTVDVRTVAADRFNQASLLKLLGSLIGKFDSDYYAFQQLRKQYKDSSVQQVRDGLLKLQRACLEEPEANIAGTYLMLRHEEMAGQPKASLRVNYLTTHGAFVGSSLTGSSSFALPTGLDSSSTRQIAPPVAGTNETTDPQKLGSLSRYYFATHDRIVTPADIKMFCYKELMSRYSISPDMIVAINVRTQPDDRRQGLGYTTRVAVSLHDTPFVKRHFTEQIPQAEFFLTKMIEVRSSSIYPIQVTVNIQDFEL